MLELTCPGCGRQLSVSEAYAGQSGQCNHCGQRLIIPGGEPSSITTRSRLRKFWLCTFHGYRVERTVRAPQARAFGSIAYKTHWVLTK